jgi:hypothetical protein
MFDVLIEAAKDWLFVVTVLWMVSTLPAMEEERVTTVPAVVPIDAAKDELLVVMELCNVSRR